MEELFLQFLKMFEWSQLYTDFDSEGYSSSYKQCPICDGDKPIHSYQCELEIMIIMLEEKLGK